MSAALGTIAYRAVGRAFHALELGHSRRDHDDLKQELFARVRSDPTLFNFLHMCSLDGLWYWNLERPEQEWLSPRLKQVLGYQDHELPNSSAWWREKVFPEDLDLATEHFQRHCADPTFPYDHVVRCRHKSGSTVRMRCRGLLIRDAAGSPIRMVGAHTNVTALPCAEAQPGVGSRFDVGPELVWTCEPDGRCDFLSEQWIGYTGIPATAQLGFGWLEQVHINDRLSLQDASNVAVATGTDSTIEVRLRRHDGAFRWFDTRAVSLCDPEDQFGQRFSQHAGSHAMGLMRQVPRRASDQDGRGTDGSRSAVSSAGKVLYASHRHAI